MIVLPTPLIFNGNHCFMSQPSIGKIRRDLVLVSFLSLFCELMIIRWLATEIRIFAYFKNLPLMAAFLGLGLGFLWTNRQKDWMKTSGICLLFLSGILIFALALHFTFLTFVDPFKFMLFGVGKTSVASTSLDLFNTLKSLLIMFGTFVLATLVFVGFGQKTGQLFEKLKPLEAYSWNVFGALLGTVIFSVLCWFNCSPGIWLIVMGVGLLSMFPKQPANYALILLGALYIFWLAPFISRAYYGDSYVETIWSPYYRIDLTREKADEKAVGKKNLYFGYTVYINYDNFQQILDCTPENLAKMPPVVAETMRLSFERPYHIFDKTPEDVLILGAANGTDPAAALRCGVKSVDGVEIDPGIVKIGRTLHPEKPYDNEKVKLYVMDARTFLRTTKKKYDLILFAYVDSHAAFSSLSSLRMDNYLFTRESLTDAAHCLKKDGVIVITFLSMADWLWQKHAKALAAATGMTPLGFCVNNGNVDVGTLISGPGIVGHTPNVQGLPPRNVDLNVDTPISTDDWPFLFLPKHEIPTVYMIPIFVVLAFGFALVIPQMKEGRKQILNWQMFLMGMGFMLLEVRAMSALSLLFGSTWIVNSTVISGVMVVILIANFVAAKLSGKHLYAIATMLILTLLGTTFCSLSNLAELGSLSGQTLGTVIFLSPMVFASVMFALLFKDTKSPSTALAFNITGGLIGVCLEYFSMLTGMQALGFIAIVIYGSVALLNLSRGKSIPKQAEPAQKTD
jgi:hypothetical protein